MAYRPDSLQNVTVRCFHEMKLVPRAALHFLSYIISDLSHLTKDVYHYFWAHTVKPAVMVLGGGLVVTLFTPEVGRAQQMFNEYLLAIQKHSDETVSGQLLKFVYVHVTNYNLFLRVLKHTSVMALVKRQTSHVCYKAV